MSGKVDATIGIAKCPVTKKLYAVCIEIEETEWTATWAFPIKPEVAKREGYTENQFPFGLLYTKDYITMQRLKNADIRGRLNAAD